jgi:cell division topological specificity factor
MNLWERLTNNRKNSASTAKERLQILLSHERISTSGKDYLPLLHRELVAVIAKYVAIDEDKVEVRLERGKGVSTLEVNIELPGPAKQPQASARA